MCLQTEWLCQRDWRISIAELWRNRSRTENKIWKGGKIHQGWPCLLLAANNIDKYRQHAIEMSETSSGGSTHGTTQITHREVCHLHTEGQRWQEVTVQRHSRSKSCSTLQWHCIRWTPQKARPAGVRCPWEQLWFNSSNVGCNSRNVYVYMYMYFQWLYYLLPYEDRMVESIWGCFSLPLLHFYLGNCLLLL